MELNTIENFLNNHGFEIIYSHYSSEYFGNIIVKIKLHNGYIVTLVKDKGDFECFIDIPKWILQKSIPVIAAINILNNESIHPVDTTFQSAEDLIAYLVKHKQELDNIDDNKIKTIYKKWE